MAKPTFKTKLLVLNKTKLGESDLIISALAEDGSLIKAVAKGARKPSNSFAARLDLFSVSDCLLAQGKNLSVFSEARCLIPYLSLRSDIDKNAAASPVLEALLKTSHEGLQIPRLFDMSVAALSSLESSPVESCPIYTAAFLLKLVAMLGFRPSFTQCIACGELINLTQIQGGVAFSYPDGGLICDDCRTGFETTVIDAALLAWAQVLLFSPFCDLEQLDVNRDLLFSLLQFCQTYLRENLSVNLKSLHYLFSCGLFM